MSLFNFKLNYLEDTVENFPYLLKKVKHRHFPPFS